MNKTKTQKRIGLLTGIIIMLFLVGCRPEEELQKGKKIGRTEALTKQDSILVKDEHVKSLKADDDEKAVDEDVISDPEKIYEAFLDNEESVVISFDADHGHYSSYKDILEDGKAYTLAEIIEGLKKGINKVFESDDEIEVMEIRNAYIDCGKDSNKELFVAVKLKAPIETYENKMIIKATNEELILCFCEDSWSRKDLSVNEYGYIETTSFDGAYNNTYEKSYVDAEGNWKFLYGAETEYAEKGEVWLESKKYVYSDYGLDMDDMMLFSYYFERLDEEANPEYTYTYAKLGEYGVTNELPYFDVSILNDDSIYYPGNEYRDFFDGIGMMTVSPKEIVAKIENQFSEKGFDTEYMKGEEVLPTEVDF